MNDMAASMALDPHMVKVVRRHVPTSLDPYHEMVALYRPEDFERRDALGRPNQGGYTMWMRMICNNPDCDSEAWVNIDLLVRQLGDAIPHEIEVSRQRKKCPIEGCEVRPYTDREFCTKHKNMLSYDDRNRLRRGEMTVEHAAHIITHKEALTR